MKIDPSVPHQYGLEMSEELNELVSEALRGCVITVQNHPRVKLRAVVLKIVVDDSIQRQGLVPAPEKLSQRTIDCIRIIIHRDRIKDRLEASRRAA